MTIAHIDETRLETDTGYRFGYLADFVGFGKDDIDAIHSAAPHLGPLVPALVDAVYDKLFSYDATKRHFVPRQSGYDGPTPEGLDALTLEHPMIAFRKPAASNATFQSSIPFITYGTHFFGVAGSTQ